MQFLAAKLGSDLDARNHLDARAGSLACGDDAGERVMIRDGDRRQAAAARQVDELGRCIVAVAVGRVQVQVRSAEVTRPIERLA